MDGAGAVVLTVAMSLIRRQDLLKTVKNLQKVSENTNKQRFGSQVSLFWSEVSVL